ncbi:hypothetical protein [Ancylobacter polymorphus]|uniref:DUF2946 domain-containing protein n=1 Tax=Ancylobacter polymorphus TaxID=223390 RepID=A0A9E7A623_9HYPH|nr:hypothetical protein [Ancylobacter polymorphus]UOK73780.1 hypothetical protein K9D25_24280 [Ancylobacter polymorphus]
MLRILALLMFCTLSLLAQGASAQAHAGHASQVRPQRDASVSAVLVSAPQKSDCLFHDARCCKSMCAMCYLPMPPQDQDVLTIRLESSALLPSREDLARLVLLGSDPPVPRFCNL